MNTDFEKLKITDDEFSAVKIANSADRPNAMSTYGGAKKSPADVKRMFDKAPELLVGKHNALVDGVVAVVREVATQGEKVTELHDALESGELKGEKGDAYILTEDDKKEISDMVESEIIGDMTEALQRILDIQYELMGIEFTLLHLNTGTVETLKALRGMTWGEWCDSKYNTIDARVNEFDEIEHTYSSETTTEDHHIYYEATALTPMRACVRSEGIEANHQYVCLYYS